MIRMPPSLGDEILSPIGASRIQPSTRTTGGIAGSMARPKAALPPGEKAVSKIRIMHTTGAMPYHTLAAVPAIRHPKRAKFEWTWPARKSARMGEGKRLRPPTLLEAVRPNGSPRRESGRGLAKTNSTTGVQSKKTNWPSFREIRNGKHSMPR